MVVRVHDWEPGSRRVVDGKAKRRPRAEGAEWEIEERIEVHVDSRYDLEPVLIAKRAAWCVGRLA